MDRNETEALEAATAQLFGSNAGPRFVAGVLRPLLKVVTLDPDQWVDVAIGGALLGNNAIRDVAISHCTGVSADRLKQLAAAVTGAATTDRAALDDVLQRVRAKVPADTTAQAEASRGNWLSRLFGKRE